METFETIGICFIKRNIEVSMREQEFISELENSDHKFWIWNKQIRSRETSSSKPKCPIYAVAESLKLFNNCPKECASTGRSLGLSINMIYQLIGIAEGEEFLHESERKFRDRIFKACRIKSRN